MATNKERKKTNSIFANNPGKGQEKNQEQPTKTKGTFISNQFDSLQTEEGEIPDLETQNKEDRLEDSRTQSPTTLSPIFVEEIMEKALNRPAFPGGTWVDMVAEE